MKQITGPSIAKLDGRYVLVVDRWLVPPADDWHDPAGGLPVDPDEGDRYIAETTANGWTQDYIYEWDGDEWIESVPEEGWMIWMLFELIFYVFFSGGWMEVGNNTFLRLDTTNDPVTGALHIDNTLMIDGVADAVQSTVQAHSSQTKNIAENQLSDETVVSGADERGILFSHGGIDGQSVYIGLDAGNINHTNAIRNIGIGSLTLSSLTTGDFNIALGYLALLGITTGQKNIALGEQVLRAITTGSNNVILGYEAGRNLALSSGSNFALGSGSMYGTGATPIVSHCVGIGLNSMRLVASGAIGNVAIGRQAMYNIGNGTYNIFFGHNAGYRQNNISNLLIIDNPETIRASAAEELTNSILYGVMAATPAAQTLRINAEILGSVGAKIGDGGTTNYTEIESDGTVVFKGAATVFKDINMGAAVLTRPAASQPTEVNFVDEVGADTGIASLGFAVGEKVSGNFELQHDYKEGTDLVFHVHWQGPAAPTGTDKVKWQLTYTVAQSETTLNATTTIVIETDFDAQYEFKRSDFAAITGTDFNIENQFLFTLERIAASADEYGGDAIVATVGIHYEVDTIGSRQVGSK